VGCLAQPMRYIAPATVESLKIGVQPDYGQARKGGMRFPGSYGTLDKILRTVWTDTLSQAQRSSAALQAMMDNYDSNTTAEGPTTSTTAGEGSDMRWAE
jgi:hypothetical protein